MDSIYCSGRRTYKHEMIMNNLCGCCVVLQETFYTFIERLRKNDDSYFVYTHVKNYFNYYDINYINDTILVKIWRVRAMLKIRSLSSQEFSVSFKYKTNFTYKITSCFDFFVYLVAYPEGLNS